MPSKCWEWSGAQDGNGYGTVRINNKTYKVHRIAYEMIYGIVPEGMVVMHHCDNKVCVNPLHLEASTQMANVRDMHNKGRSRWTRANQELWSTVVDLWDTGLYTQKEIASMVGRSQPHVSRIVRSLQEVCSSE